MMDFKIVNGILNWDDGSCMPATDEHLAMWEKINQLQAEVERLKAAQQKEGYVLVPVEPTEAMIDKAFRLEMASEKTLPIEELYKAMIAAAQEPT